MKSESVYKPVRFFMMTFLITWISWFIAAYFSYQEGMEGLQILTMLPGLLAPFIAALIMMSGKDNRGLRKDFWERLSPMKIKLRYLPAILLIMPVTVLLATALSLLFGQEAEQFKLSSEFQIMSGQVVISVVILFLAPTLEELGWRGYGVDSIRSKLDLFKTTMLFAVVWALWHLPLFFIKGYYHNDLWHMGLVYAANFFVSVLPATVLMNWMYYKNERSITVTILFHFILNLFSVLFQTEQFTKCIMTALLMILSIVIIATNKDMFFGKAKE